MKKFFFPTSLLFLLGSLCAMEDKNVYEKNPMFFFTGKVIDFDNDPAFLALIKPIADQANDPDRDPVQDILDQPCYGFSKMRYTKIFELKNNDQIEKLQKTGVKELLIKELFAKYKKIVDLPEIKKDFEY
jgi:hypothetical protein